MAHTLAYGSLIDNPGGEIVQATRQTVKSVQTPFKVEFAEEKELRFSLLSRQAYKCGR